jgi:hypothetical protein
VAESSNK